MLRWRKPGALAECRRSAPPPGRNKRPGHHSLLFRRAPYLLSHLPDAESLLRWYAICIAEGVAGATLFDSRPETVK